MKKLLFGAFALGTLIACNSNDSTETLTENTSMASRRSCPSEQLESRKIKK